MARPEMLIPGNCYFTVAFYDEDMLLPMIETFVYVGMENDREAERVWLFKEPTSDSEAAPPLLWACPEDQLHTVLGFDELLERLKEIAFGHPLQVSGRPAQPSTFEDFAGLPGAITTLIGDREITGLTITLRFTDEGVSIQRADQTCTIDFVTFPRRDSDRSSAILALFGEHGVRPSVDYLCDGGRTRILHFPSSCEADAITQLCYQVFTKIYPMQRGDVLDFRFWRAADIQR